MFDLAEWNVGFWLMVVIGIAAVAVLGLAILYGTRMWRKRPQDPRTKQAADEATWRLYHPASEADEGPGPLKALTAPLKLKRSAQGLSNRLGTSRRLN